MFKPGDLVLYGGTGVCRIVSVASSFSGEKSRLYYTLKPLYQTCTITTPVDNNKVFMRPIISKSEAERLIDSIPSIHAEVYHSKAMRELTEHYQAILSTYDCRNLIQLTMSINAKKQLAEAQHRKFGAVDERYLKRAEDLLFGELAAALEIDRAKVQSYIAERLGNSN